MRAKPCYVPPPCFYYNFCGRAAELEKCGRAVCRGCAAAYLRGREYPLREPTRRPLYSSDNDAAESVDMADSSPKDCRQLSTKLYSFD